MLRMCVYALFLYTPCVDVVMIFRDVFSEIRLVEILEGLCESSSFECNHMVEEYEEHFETWWFKRLGTHLMYNMRHDLFNSCFIVCYVFRFNSMSIKKQENKAP